MQVITLAHRPARARPQPTTDERCALVALAAELRKIIWIHAVTEWQPPVNTAQGPVLHKRPIRFEKYKRSSPPAITEVSVQIRRETLKLYYQHNIFECWRPRILRTPSALKFTMFGGWLLSRTRAGGLAPQHYLALQV